jgi:hypothetical protein
MTMDSKRLASIDQAVCDRLALLAARTHQVMQRYEAGELDAVAADLLTGATLEDMRWLDELRDELEMTALAEWFRRVTVVLGSSDPGC